MANSFDECLDVYKSYIDRFLGGCDKSKNLLEILSQFEVYKDTSVLNGENLCSRSVKTYSEGLKLFNNDDEFNRIYREYVYKKEGCVLTDSESAEHFLKYWGLASLFQDIGYLLELPFENMIKFFETDKKSRKDSIYISYHGLEKITSFNAAETNHFKKLYDRIFVSLNRLLAYDIAEKLGDTYGFDEAYILHGILTKPTNPEKYGYYMDHAVFSSIRMYQELVESIGVGRITSMHIDALSAILIHNSFYEQSILGYKEKNKRVPLEAEIHPLAYLLIVCNKE